MTFQAKATRIQRIMIGLMLIVYLALIVWSFPEIAGIISETAEDTFSEWVWDTPDWIFWPLTVFHGIAGGIFVWSAGHFIEGRQRRKKIARKRKMLLTSVLR